MLAKIRLAIAVVLLRGIKAVVRLLPGKTSTSMASSLGAVTGRFCQRELAISCAQLRYVFSDEDSSSAVELSSKVFRHAGESFVDALLWDRYFAASSRVEKKDSYLGLKRTATFRHVTTFGDGILSRIRERGQSAVGLSGHIGCFELAAAHFAKAGLPASIIGRIPNYPALGILLDELRTGYGVETIWRDSPAVGKQIIRAIKNNRLVCALIDNDTNVKNAFSPFFQLEAANAVSPVQLAVRYRVPIFTSFAVRARRLHHYLFTEEIRYDPKDPDEAIRQILQTFNERLEKLICLFPEQWLWWHRRWRRRPGVDYSQSSAKLRSTEEYISWISSQQKKEDEPLSQHGRDCAAG